MLDLSICCHLGTSWPIHLYDLPALSLFSGIGGSCFSPSQCTISIRATALSCPRQHPLLCGLSKWCPLELCSTQPRQPYTALYSHIFQKKAKLSISRKITIPSAFPMFLIRFSWNSSCEKKYCHKIFREEKYDLKFLSELHSHVVVIRITLLWILKLLDVLWEKINKDIPLSDKVHFLFGIKRIFLV